MCGIAGTFAYHYAALPVDRDELRTVRDYMIARDPDGKGEWYSDDNRVGLAHRRLAIIDLTERAVQPMISGDGRYVISFNGEIYNYQALRKKLIQKGYKFNSTSDTEVILHLFAEKKEGVLADLRGMFSFAIWDNEEQKLFIARDPYGIKPLYFSDDGKKLRFASQVKALLAGGGISKERGAAGIVGFYLFGSLPEPYTLFKQIRAVPAGSYIWVNNSGPCEPIRYFSMAEAWRDSIQEVSDISEEELRREFREGLLDSVKHHLEADVPVGAFLSAGIDSGVLVGMMSELSGPDKPITTITLGFDEFAGTHDDETKLAEVVTKIYGTRHITRRISEDEFNNDLPEILSAMDQPSIDGLNTWFANKAAKEQGLKVAVSGLGGDELFGGSPAFSEVPRWVRYFSVPSKVPYLGDLIVRLGGTSIASRLKINPKAWGLIKYGGTYPGAYFLKRGMYMPSELPGILDHSEIQSGLDELQLMDLINKEMNPDPGSPFARIASLESALYMKNQLLRDSDWASMAHSVEIRAPLVDSVLLKTLAPFIASTNSDSSKRVFGLTPVPSLPDDILLRRKSGFRTPVESWMTNLNNSSKSKLNLTTSFTGKEPWARKWAKQVIAAHL
jgi:asparagine synthase (glutamine-hydrolysing)